MPFLCSVFRIYFTIYTAVHTKSFTDFATNKKISGFFAVEIRIEKNDAEPATAVAFCREKIHIMPVFTASAHMYLVSIAVVQTVPNNFRLGGKRDLLQVILCRNIR